MDVKTVFKTIFLTVIIIGLATFLTELYNASVNSALLRQKIDSAAESSLNYYNQESFRQEGTNATVNLPNFLIGSTGATYVSGQFYDHADNPQQQVAEMFEWYPGASGSLGYSNANALRVYEVAMLNDGGHQTYDYDVSIGGQQLGFDINCRRLPTVSTGLSPYNLVVPGTAEYFSHTCTGKPKQYFGIVNRYTEDMNELTRWGTYSNYDSMAKVTNILDKYGMRTGGGSNDMYMTNAEMEHVYKMGALNAFTHIEDAVTYGYTPANTGFPMFSWQLNRMFKWHLCSSLAGVGVDQSAIGGSYTTPAIDEDEEGSGIYCMKWNGFNVYVDQARITDLNYYAYNLYDSGDLYAFCSRAGLDVNEFKANSMIYTAIGYNGKAFANTVVAPDGTPYSFAMIVDIDYTVPVAYRGITPFRRVINWITADRKAGYARFTAGNTQATATGAPAATYATTNMNGSVGDNAFMVDSSLQYVIMP